MKLKYACLGFGVICCTLTLITTVAIIARWPERVEMQASERMDGQLQGSCWVPQGREYCAPQFIIAGAMKCGTTSMFSYLLKHPKVDLAPSAAAGRAGQPRVG